MLTLLFTAGVAGAEGIFGHTQARSFVGRRLRFTSFVEKPALGVVAGVAAAVIAAPVVALIPVIGAGTALVFGAGVGTGAALGAQDAKKPLLED